MLWCFPHPCHLSYNPKKKPKRVNGLCSGYPGKVLVQVCNGGHWVEALGCPTLHTVGSSCATPPRCTAGPFSGHLWEIRFKKVHTVQGMGKQKGVRNSPASCSQEEGRRCCGQWSRDSPAAPGEMRVEQVFLWSLWRDPMGAKICAAAHGGSPWCSRWIFPEGTCSLYAGAGSAGRNGCWERSPCWKRLILNPCSPWEKNEARVERSVRREKQQKGTIMDWLQPPCCYHIFLSCGFEFWVPLFLHFFVFTLFFFL